VLCTHFNVKITYYVPDLISSNVSMTPVATDAALFGRILPTAVSRGRFDQSRPTTRKKGCRMPNAARPASWFPFVAALRCDAAYAGCDPRVGMKLFLLPAGAYRELIIPNYLESMYLAKLPKSLHPPNNIMRELKMKLRGHGRAGINSRSNYRYHTAICPNFNGNRTFPKLSRRLRQRMRKRQLSRLEKDPRLFCI